MVSGRGVFSSPRRELSAGEREDDEKDGDSEEKIDGEVRTNLSPEERRGRAALVVPSAEADCVGRRIGRAAGGMASKNIQR